MASVQAPRSRPVAISGGSARQRVLLRAIVAAQRPAAVSALRIAPANPAWKPLRPGDVELTATLSPAASPLHENLLGEWESWVIGGAFRDRSAVAGLPRVVVVGDGDGASRVSPANSHLPARSPAGLSAFEQRVRTVLRRFRVHIAYLQAGVPDGFTAAVGLETPYPAPFIEHRLGAVGEALYKLRSDGWLIVVYDRRGRLVDVGGNGARMGIGGGDVVDHRYDGCDQNDLFSVPSLPDNFAPALFCPSDWRPPASTPPRPLRVTRAVAGGTQGGFAADGTAHVPFRPGLRFGVGFALQNMNGTPVRVQSITVGGAPGTGIHFTGLRVQVPASRLHPGNAGELLPPYEGLSPLRPVAIRPGDWVGVAMHFLVAPCTPSTSGRTFVSDRSVRVSWRLDGRLMSHTYASVPLQIHVPAC
jgi:hypothetical protein